MNTVLLTGATGFVGAHVARALAEAGHRVRATVRATSDTRWIDALGLEHVQLDLRSEEGARAAVQGMARVVHVAGLTRAKSEDEFMRVNADGTERLAAAAAAAGCERFVLLSSLAARGPDGASGPVSPYGRSKREGERRLEAHREALDPVILRPGGVYGPCDSDLLPLFQMAARGVLVVPRGAPELQPIYGPDVASAAVAALECPSVPEPLPLAHPDRHSWDDVARRLAAAVGREVRKLALPAAVFWTAGLLAEGAARVTGGSPAMDRRRARDLSHHAWTCDIEPTRSALGWTPAVGLERGMRETARWYREVGWL